MSDPEATAQSREGASGLRAEIVTTGTEILLGEIVDTNAAWMAQQLREAGINLYYKTTVGDNEARVRSVIELGLSRSDVILVSGGLGPTKDDITRQAIAAATGCPLELRADAVETLKACFARFGAQMTENNLQQAMIPMGATLIENPVGTAPGFIVETARGTVIALPGVPREMKHLMSETVLPYLRAKAGNTGIIRRRVLRTMGIGESMIDERLHDLMTWANPTVGLAAHTAQCDVRITARAASAGEAEALLDGLEAEIRTRIGEYIYSTTPDEPYEAMLVRALSERSLTLALLESNTLGKLAQRLVSGQGAARVLVMSCVVGEPGVPDEVSRAVDEVQRLGLSNTGIVALAEIIRRSCQADMGIAILGTTGAQDGVYGTGAGSTWIGVSGPAGSRVLSAPHGGSDDYTVTRIGNQAMSELWKLLQSS
jgi:nicotinamide-nucleotide amidase